MSLVACEKYKKDSFNSVAPIGQGDSNQPQPNQLRFKKVEIFSGGRNSCNHVLSPILSDE
jgi:hypothetical protein